MNTDNFAGRHEATRQLVRWFEYGHLPKPLQRPARSVALLASQMVYELSDCAELTAGLRKLLEAKDCFVRAAILAHDNTQVDQP